MGRLGRLLLPTSGSVVMVMVMVMVVGMPHVRHDLDGTMFHAAQAADPVGGRLQLVRPAAQDNHFQAVVVTQMNVHGGADAFAELVLDLGQPIAQVPDVVIVDNRQGRHGFDPAGDFGPVDLRAGHIPEQFRSGALALIHQRIQLLQKGGIDGDSEPFERRPRAHECVHRSPNASAPTASKSRDP